MLIDTHSHLNDERLLPSATRIADEMLNDNLSAIFNVGYDRTSTECVIDLAEKFENFYAIIGTHPHDSKKLTDEDLQFYRESAKNPKVLAIGEIGLDYFYDLSDRDVQKTAFEKQINLANEVKLPIVIHLRDAYKDMLDILNSNKDKLTYGGVVHCYSGSQEILGEILNLGLNVSYGGIITFKNYAKQEAIAYTPLDRIILETDCPYLTPAPFRGTLNYPKYVEYVYQEISKIKNICREDLEKAITENIKRIFNRYNGHNSI